MKSIKKHEFKTIYFQDQLKLTNKTTYPH